MKSTTTYSLDVDILKKFNSKVADQQRSATIEKLMSDYLNKISKEGVKK